MEDKVKKAWESYQKTGKIKILSEVEGKRRRRPQVEQLPTAGADYSKHSTDLLKVMLEPGALHADEQGFKRLIRAELKKRGEL